MVVKLKFRSANRPFEMKQALANYYTGNHVARLEIVYQYGG
jgi:hypothetical protein